MYINVINQNTNQYILSIKIELIPESAFMIKYTVHLKHLMHEINLICEIYFKCNFYLK